ncbi:hypothetical protein BKA61DRAFT_317061 [Leptodontidium sp. MPI-SDFR-AT-0119]|nr:hypothetical protein BKA61DRAFT_317061 [Leptodontidium sp. MPI-SDFR-AT-0119]
MMARRAGAATVSCAVLCSAASGDSTHHCPALEEDRTLLSRRVHTVSSVSIQSLNSRPTTRPTTQLPTYLGFPGHVGHKQPIALPPPTKRTGQESTAVNRYDCTLPYPERGLLRKVLLDLLNSSIS